MFHSFDNSIIAGSTITIVDILLFLGLIWYERFETHNGRTLMNKMFSSMCWASIFSLTATSFDILRYMTGPLNPTICYVIFNLKIMFKTMTLLCMDALILIR